MTIRAANQRRLVEHPTDIQCRNRVSAELKYAISADDAVPAVSEILKVGVEWIPGVEPVRVVENGPQVEFLPESPNEKSEVCDNDLTPAVSKAK